MFPRIRSIFISRWNSTHYKAVFLLNGRLLLSGMLLNFLISFVAFLMIIFSENSGLLLDNSVIQLCFAHSDDKGGMFDGLNIIIVVVFDLSLD